MTICLTAAALTGCGNDKGSDAQSGTKGTETTGGTSAAGTNSGGEGTSRTPEEFTYPMKETTFKVNYGSDMYDTSNAEWAKDFYFHKQLKEATGVTLQDVGALPNAYDPSEEFLLLLASNDYPDLFWCNWVSFPGGPETAIEDKYIIALNEYEEYFPNLMNYLNENPDVKRMVTTDDGTLYCFPFIRDYGLQVETGAVVRQDWLTELGLSVPETIEDWHTVLTAFKNEKGVSSPLTFESRWLFLEYATSPISSAFGAAYPFYVENGTVKFGPMEEGYRNFVTEMAKWYSEGLIDQDMPSVDKSTVTAKFANGESGMVINQLGKMSSCLEANAGTDYAISGVPTAVANAGDEKKFSHFRNQYDGSYSVSISTQCKDIEAACRYLDYLYSEEGHMLINFGTEGISYNMQGDEVVFTDIIMNNPDANPSSARNKVGMYYNWPNVTEDSSKQLDEGIKTIQSTWLANMDQYAYPTVTYTEEETKTISELYSTIDDYSREMILKFIIGTESIDNYDKYLNTLSTYGIEDVLAAKQEAYDRYMSR